LIDRWRDKEMHVIRHDNEAVELKAAFIAMLEERGDEEFGVGRSLEVAMLLEGRDRDGVRALRLADCRHAKESIPQGDPRLKPWATSPSISGWDERAKPEGLAYLDAVRALHRMMPFMR
jgi:hypothetical protein